MGSPTGTPNLAMLMALLNARGMRPQASTGRAHRLCSTVLRPNANQAASNTAARPQAQPVVRRLRLVNSMSTPMVATRRRVWSSRTPMSANRLPSVRAMLHMRSSAYTHGTAARNTKTDPPVMAARSTPIDVASARPSGALPRRTIRMRHTRRVLNNPITIHASKMEGAPELALEAGGEDQEGHPQQRGEDPEVRELATAVHEPFDAELALGYPEVTVHHRQGLQVVDAGSPGGAERVDVARPQVPQDPDKGHRTHRQGDHGGELEPLEVGVADTCRRRALLHGGAFALVHGDPPHRKHHSRRARLEA